MNWWEAAYDGIWGAVNGALSATGLTAPVAIGLGALSGGLSSIGSDLIFNDGNINVANAILNTVLGAASGIMAGGGAENWNMPGSASVPIRKFPLTLLPGPLLIRHTVFPEIPVKMIFPAW